MPSIVLVLNAMVLVLVIDKRPTKWSRGVRADTRYPREHEQKHEQEQAHEKENPVFTLKS